LVLLSVRPLVLAESIQDAPHPRAHPLPATESLPVLLDRLGIATLRLTLLLHSPPNHPKYRPRYRIE
jgi:hypothetical protein